MAATGSEFNESTKKDGEKTEKRPRGDGEASAAAEAPAGKKKGFFRRKKKEKTTSSSGSSKKQLNGEQKISLARLNLIPECVSFCCLAVISST
ncbi:hypothetical protein AXF42_Ash017890 [Apostasia shenzhenica]|uniref:Uncharacterized protein n=1 Tax=Apostasia shenzhenica TaxID=1088818 RepID=A0A2I0AY72_9ASPA|nr:hypothetical protein AXF42_Ash017890 [Apostasia shenzhenica]